MNARGKLSMMGRRGNIHTYLPLTSYFSPTQHPRTVIHTTALVPAPFYLFLKHLLCYGRRTARILQVVNPTRQIVSRDFDRTLNLTTSNRLSLGAN